ncbi:MAG: oligosaccharide flippase family protein [Actinomycetota bacterium]|nr:oligosaccharide flippase family protein [Actinomycetota bacterium]
MSGRDAPSPVDRQATFLRATVSITACRAASIVLASVVAILTARELGPAGRGAFVLLLTIASVTAVVCTFGMNLAGRVHMVAASDPIPLNEYCGLSMVLALLSALVSGIAGATLLPSAGVRVSAAELLLFSTLGTTLLTQLVLTDALNAFGFTVLAARVEVGGFLIQVVMVTSLVVAGVERFQLYVIAVVLSGVFQSAAALFLLRRRVGPIRPRYHYGHWRRLIRTGSPGMPSTLSQLLTLRVDRYLVGAFLNPAAVGVYSVASTVPEFLRVVPMALGQSVFYGVASNTSTAASIRRAMLTCLAATTGLAMAIFVVAPVAVATVFGREFSGAVTPLRILLLAEIGMIFFHVEGSVLGGQGRLSAGGIAAAAGFVLVLIGDLLLIPAFDLAGAAWASVIAYSAMGLIVHRLVRSGAAGKARGTA